MSILAIIAAIGTTALLNHLPNMRLKSAARDIFSTMMKAKVEAIKQGGCVAVLFRPGQNNDYLMFFDNGENGGTDCDGTINGTEKTLQLATSLPNGVRFDPSVSGDGISFLNNALIFTQRGLPFGLGNGTVGLLAVDSSGNAVRQRTITVSSSGRINLD